MVLTGDIISATEAERLGLINRVVPEDELEKATMELAEKIAAKNPFSVRTGKAGIYGIQCALTTIERFNLALPPLMHRYQVPHLRQIGLRADLLFQRMTLESIPIFIITFRLGQDSVTKCTRALRNPQRVSRN
jgi:hypothetical protein